MYPEKVILTFAQILDQQVDFSFKSKMIENLTKAIASRKIYPKLAKKLFEKAKTGSNEDGFF